MIPINTHAGLRRFIRICRWKTMLLSRTNAIRGPLDLGLVLVLALRIASLRVAQRPAGQGEEHVVQGRPEHLDRVELDPRGTQVAEQPGYDATRPLHAAT